MRKKPSCESNVNDENQNGPEPPCILYVYMCCLSDDGIWEQK